MSIFRKSLDLGRFEEDSILCDGSKMKIDRVYPLDAIYDDKDDVPEETWKNKRYRGVEVCVAFLLEVNHR